MKRLYFLLLAILSTFVLAESKEIQAQLDEAITLNVGDTATISELRVTLVSVNDDGCGRARECYWIAYRDATFQVWQGEEDLGEIALSTASREDSKRFVRVGEYYIILKDAIGYETDIDTAEFYVTKTLELYQNQY
ncbi:MAG: hypothetical protein ACRCYY_10470 [Trueperaceae bacterium]